MNQGGVRVIEDANAIPKLSAFCGVEEGVEGRESVGGHWKRAFCRLFCTR